VGLVSCQAWAVIVSWERILYNQSPGVCELRSWAGRTRSSSTCPTAVRRPRPCWSLSS